MWPPLPVTIRPIFGSLIPSTVASTRTAFLVPKNSAELGISTHDHSSPLTSTPIGAVKVWSRGPGWRSLFTLLEGLLFIVLMRYHQTTFGRRNPIAAHDNNNRNMNAGEWPG